MPIFEYLCEDCNRAFESLQIGSREPECPHCHGQRLNQQISVFSVGAPRSGATAPAPQSCGAPSCCMGSSGCDN
ncbi:MAG: FmdB family zinc ribbon protein [Candidatus Korobacteraceae bacterium]